jgi:hypothetical protein
MFKTLVEREHQQGAVGGAMLVEQGVEPSPLALGQVEVVEMGPVGS